jgi:serine/threonine protein kinase
VDTLEELYQCKVALARYLPREILDQSTFGILFRVEDRESGKTRVLKVAPDGPASLHASQRLKREIQVLERLDHPNIVKLLGVEEVPAGPCLVLEDLGDETLDRLAPEADPLELLFQISQALEVLHAKEVVHRDLKPANMVRAPGNRAVLIDFGGCFHPDMSQWTAPGQVAGTLPYIAPEVFRGGLVTPAADWYSWGVCLYRLLEGAVPFEETQYELEVPGGSLPSFPFTRLSPNSPEATLIQACLHWDPRQRPGSKAELRTALSEGGGAWRRFLYWLGG